MSGVFSVRWDSATRSRSAVPSSVTKMQCKNSNARLGLHSKKSPERETADCIHRRVGNQRTAHPRAHLGAERENADYSVSLQLDAFVGDCRFDQNKLPVPFPRRKHQKRANRRV